MSALQDRLTPDGAAKIARFAAFAMMAAFGIGAFSFGALAFVASSRASSEEERSRGLQKEVSRIQSVLQDARSRTAVAVDNESRAVAAFQKSVSGMAQAYSCKLSEFLASTDVQPFLTRFEKQGASNGWNQIEAQFTLVGPTRFVFELLIQLATQPVPIELNSVQINREDVSDAGSITRAKVQLRILVQSGGASA